MMNQKYPLTLSNIKFSIYSSADRIAMEFPGDSLFDDRHDFAYNKQLQGLATLIFVENKRLLSSNGPSRGVRRHLCATLIDATSSVVMDTQDFRIDLSSYDLVDCHRVDFKLTYDDIDEDHTYRVVVRDYDTHHVLGEDTIRLFDEATRSRHICDSIEVTGAGICSCYGDELYKAFSFEFLSENRVRFNITTHFDNPPLILPEFEVRIHYAEGRIESAFCRAESVVYGDENQYRIQKPFLLYDDKKGVCYAELLCMDYAIAGFVFCTDYDDWIEGPWIGDDVKCLDVYTHDTAVQRFASSIKGSSDDSIQVEDDIDNNDDKVDDDDAFDKLLDEFLKLEMDDESDDKETANDTAEDKAPKESPMQRLDLMTGLKSVKDKLHVYENIVKFHRLRVNHGLPNRSLPLHALFLGSPGTGKTTVAKMMGEMLAEAGILSSGHVVVKERATLLGPNYSMEETNTLEAVDKAQGGILFIDEAYQLCQPDDPRDPGKFVIEALMTALADESRRDWMLILAGYPDKMKRMFEINPGLKSRIPESNIYTFDDFTEDELMEIAERYLCDNCFNLSDGAYKALRQRLRADYTMRDKSFGNARHVINLIQTEILPAMACRVVSQEFNPCADALAEIKACDIPQPRSVNIDNRRIGFRA